MNSHLSNILPSHPWTTEACKTPCSCLACYSFLLTPDPSAVYHDNLFTFVRCLPYFHLCSVFIGGFRLPDCTWRCFVLLIPVSGERSCTECSHWVNMNPRRLISRLPHLQFQWLPLSRRRECLWLKARFSTDMHPLLSALTAVIFRLGPPIGTAKIFTMTSYVIPFYGTDGNSIVSHSAVGIPCS